MKERVACYIRVSTELEEQDSSYINQEFYFRNKYNDNEVLIYKDKGTGTSFKRPDFQRLLTDAGLDKLDERETNKKLVFIQSDREPLFKRIIVKDTSRFARNIIIMDIIRELAGKGVFIFFEDMQKDTSNEGDMVLLQMLFTFAENTSRSISMSTKFGNKRTMEQNKIRNNSLYGYNFNRETNELISIKEESEVVRLIFDLALTDGFRVIANKLNQLGVKNRKGQAFSQHTLVNMLRNKKYCGYNVRGRCDSVNLFGNHKYILKNKNEWVEMPCERIEPIISEELYKKVQVAIESRCIAGNKGKNVSKRDTRNKLICGKCGAKYILASDKRIDTEDCRSYYICSHKKTRGKSYCDAENIKKKSLDKFIELQRTVVYPNSFKLNIKLKIRQIKKQIKDIDKVDRYKKIRELENELSSLQEKMEVLIENMISNSSQTTSKIFAKKIEELEIRIKNIEDKVNDNQKVLLDRDKYKNELDKKIRELEYENDEIPEVLTREEYLKRVDSLIINGKEDIKVTLR